MEVALEVGDIFLVVYAGVYLVELGVHFMV